MPQKIDLFQKKIGIDAFIMKPINKNEIAKTIKKILDKKNLSAEYKINYL